MAIFLLSPSLPVDATLRHERKFLCGPLSEGEAAALALALPGGFRRAHPDRAVNSLYLDGEARPMFHENLDGHPERVKARIRWYGPLEGEARPVLEFKIKHGHLGRKAAFPLPAFVFALPAGPERLLEATLVPPALPEAARELLRPLSPAALVRYTRAYFVSACGRFRLTVDRDLSARTPEGRPLPGAARAVLELKYAPADDGDARDITAALPFRLARHSKYADALARSL